MKTNKKITLEEIATELPFSVPENYFEQFALQIDRQIGYKTPQHRFIRSWMYAAAMIVAIFVVSSIFYSTNQRNLARNAENYESYVMTQVDEPAVVDYYVNNQSK